MPLPLRRAAVLSALVLSAPALAYTDPQYGFFAVAPQGWRQASYPARRWCFWPPES